MTKILLVEDNIIERTGIETFLISNGFNVILAADGEEALRILDINEINLVITDLQMPKMNGLELLHFINQRKIKIPAIVITAYDTIENAVKAMKEGAEDFLTKPINLAELKIKIDKITKQLKLIDENIKLKKELEQILYPEIIASTAEMEKVNLLVKKIAQDVNVSVMIYGESGTGKEVIAKNIHAKSSRKDYSFTAVNCAALPEDLLESELFGYCKGAFTGALNDKIGIFQAADKGTIFLDEVSEMSPKLQAKLLRVLQEYEIQPIGRTEKVNIDVRIIGASNVNLRELVNKQIFREDLFYRLNVVEINLPPLRNRVEDIPLLIEHFLKDKKIRFTVKAIEAMKKYSWPGNIRELQNFIKMIEVISDKQIITEQDLPQEFHTVLQTNNFIKLNDTSDYKNALSIAIKNFEKHYLTFHLTKNNGNISRTAEMIGMSRVSLHKKIKEYNLPF